MSKLQSLKQLLSEIETDALIISSVPQISYLTNFNGFSMVEREAFLIITKNNNYILTDGRYSEVVINQLTDFQLLEISLKTPMEKILQILAKQDKLKKILIEEQNISYHEYKLFTKYFTQILPLKLHDFRSAKTNEEIKSIQMACQIGDQVFKKILKKFKIGVSEKQIAFELEYFIKKKGADISFPTIVAFDQNASIPHHQTGEDQLAEKNGQFILLDFGVKINNYCSDMTRTIFWGTPSSRQIKIYSTVLEAQQQSVTYINTKLRDEDQILAKNVDKQAREYILKQGFSSIPHSLGHGIGLEVHEHPRISLKSKDILKPGMVFSIEPGIYLPKYGGVRIEDLFALQEQQLLQLTTADQSLIVL